MNAQQLVNFQDQGAVSTLALANQAIHLARTATPWGVRLRYCSRIQYLEGMYYWYWILS